MVAVKFQVVSGQGRAVNVTLISPQNPNNSRETATMFLPLGENNTLRLSDHRAEIELHHVQTKFGIQTYDVTCRGFTSETTWEHIHRFTAKQTNKEIEVRYTFEFMMFHEVSNGCCTPFFCRLMRTSRTSSISPSIATSRCVLAASLWSMTTKHCFILSGL